MVDGMSRVQKVNVLLEQVGDLNQMRVFVLDFFQFPRPLVRRYVEYQHYNLFIPAVLIGMFIIPWSVSNHSKHTTAPPPSKLDQVVSSSSPPAVPSSPTPAPPIVETPRPPKRKMGQLRVYSMNSHDGVWIEILPGARRVQARKGRPPDGLAEADIKLREGRYEIRCSRAIGGVANSLWSEVRAGQTTQVHCFPP